MELKIEKQKIDWSKPAITGKDLDFATYEHKFKVADYIRDNMLLDSEDKVIRNKATACLDDDTIYSYLLLRDDEGEPFKATAYQDLISNLHHDFTPNCVNRYILFKASNQIGKSRMLISKSIKIAFTEVNRNIVMISKSLPQSQFLLAQLRHTLNNSVFGESWKEELGETANTTVLTIQRKIPDKTSSQGFRIAVNRIICAPCGEGTLGYPIHYLFLDEGDFYEDAKIFFWKVAFARTKKTKGQIIVFSNPNPTIARASSLLWELWNGDLFQRKFSFSFLDAPWNTKEEYELDKRNSPSYIFQSTHDGNFPDDGGAFLSYSEIRDMLKKEWINVLPPADRTVYIALDLGKMRDQTVISVGMTKKPMREDDKYLDLDVKYQQALPIKTGYDDITKRLKEIISIYKEQGINVVVGFDATGQKTFGDLLKTAGVSAIPVDFSRKESNKTLLYNDFKLMCENRKIKIVYSRTCENQLSGLEFKLTEGKKLKKVEAKTETIHDDYPDSLVILVHIAVKPSRVPVSLVRVGAQKDKEQKAPTQQDSAALAMKQAIEANKKTIYGRTPWS